RELSRVALFGGGYTPGNVAILLCGSLEVQREQPLEDLLVAQRPFPAVGGCHGLVEALVRQQQRHGSCRRVGSLPQRLELVVEPRHRELLVLSQEVLAYLMQMPRGAPNAFQLLRGRAGEREGLEAG